MILNKLAIALTTGVTLTAVSSAAQAVTLTYEGEIGSPGFGPGELFVMQGIGVGPDDNIYVANGRGIIPETGEVSPFAGNRIDVFSPDGEYLRAISQGGNAPGQLDGTADIKFDPITGDLFIGDVFNSEVDVYNPLTGEFVRSFGSFGGPVADRPFFGPGGFDFNADANLYVSDFSADIIKVYDPAGELVETIGSSGSEPGQFLGPAGLIISESTGRIYITDQFNNRIQVLDADGEFLFAFGSEGVEPGQFNEPIGIEVDEFENIYVADSQNGRVQVFDSEGNFLTAFGEPARTEAGDIIPPPAPNGLPFGDPLVLEPGVFNWTAGLNYQDGTLLVGDFFQGRVQVIDVDNADSTPVPEPASLLGLLAIGLAAMVNPLKRR